MKQTNAPLRQVVSLRHDMLGACDRCKGLGKYSINARMPNGRFKPTMVICEFCYHRPIV